MSRVLFLCVLSVFLLSLLLPVHCNVLNRHRLSSSIGAVKPGALNYFNFTRPEGLREFYLYVPTTYNPANAYPLAIYFHGYGTGPVLQNGYHQGIYLNMTVDAENAGYLIAFPNGTPSGEGFLSWDAGRCCKRYNATMMRVDDVIFTRRMLAIIQDNANVDPRRRYAMGWSNGGFMSERLACEAHELFAGIVADASSVVIGADAATGQDMCDSSFGSASLNFFYLKGTNDAAVPWTGSAYNNPAGVPSALDDIARWSNRLGCSALVQQTFNDGVFSNLVWPKCRNNSQIEFMTVRNGVHQWWTMTNTPGFPFETTQYVLNFFTRTFEKQHMQ